MKRALLMLLAVCLPASALGAPVAIGNGTRVELHLGSMVALRDRHLVRQAYDYSCGAASLATLLSFGLGDFVTEAEVLEGVFGMLAGAEAATRRERGLSLLDLKRFAESRGHRATGLRLEPAYLARLGAPVIVYLEQDGFPHFAVFRGLRDGRVHLADPSRGNVRMPLPAFLELWLTDAGRGLIFVVESAGTALVDSLLAIADGRSARPEVLAIRRMLDSGTRTRHVRTLPR